MADTVDHVSDTAFWVAHYRAVETRRRDALFRDPFAEKLSGERGRRVAKHMGAERAMQWTLSIRTIIIDDLIVDAIKGGVDLVLNLGAGLDARPYRLDLAADFQWVEADFPHMIDYKTEVLAGETPVCRLERVACDLSDDVERRKLLSEVNARGRNILVLTEGVIPYLSNAAVGSLAQDLEAQDHIAFWITDYSSPFFQTITARSGIRKRLAHSAPFLFDPGPETESWPRFFAEKHWQIKNMRFIGEEGCKVGRDLPAGPIGRFFMQFAPEERLRPYRRMNGYALLQKGEAVVTL
jgi:methyltransferase (TIGR00027 family)